MKKYVCKHPDYPHYEETKPFSFNNLFKKDLHLTIKHNEIIQTMMLLVFIFIILVLIATIILGVIFL